MLISSGVSNMCLFAPAPYYKLNKGFFLGFLFKQESLGKVSYMYGNRDLSVYIAKRSIIEIFLLL